MINVFKCVLYYKLKIMLAVKYLLQHSDRLLLSIVFDEGISIVV